MDVLQTLFKKLKTVVCRPILNHGFPIQSKSIVKITSKYNRNYIKTGNEEMIVAVNAIYAIA